MPRSVRQLGLYVALAGGVATTVLYLAPQGDKPALLFVWALTVFVIAVVVLCKQDTTDKWAFVRWDKMPEKVQCPDCEGSGALEYRSDGTRHPVPFHMVSRMANAHGCKLCLGAGTTAQHPAARTGEWKRRPRP